MSLCVRGMNERTGLDGSWAELGWLRKERGWHPSIHSFCIAVWAVCLAHIQRLHGMVWHCGLIQLFPLFISFAFEIPPPLLYDLGFFFSCCCQLQDVEQRRINILCSVCIAQHNMNSPTQQSIFTLSIQPFLSPSFPFLSSFSSFPVLLLVLLHNRAETPLVFPPPFFSLFFPPLPTQLASQLNDIDQRQITYLNLNFKPPPLFSRPLKPSIGNHNPTFISIQACLLRF